MISQFIRRTVSAGLWSGLLLCGALAARAQSPVTFQVDMSVAATNGTFAVGSDTLEVRGGFQGWAAGYGLTNDPAGANPNLYSGTFNISDAAGTVESYKFVVDGGSGPLGYESPASTAGGNRQFTLAGGAQTLPAVYFNDLSPNAPISPVTFQVDMSAQVILGKFSPGLDFVEVRGGFQGWAGGYSMTNDPGGSNPNLYTGTFSITAAVGTVEPYKFVVDNGGGPLGYESPASTGGNNRQFTQTSGPQTLPVVYFNDLSPTTPTNNVTFQVDMFVGVIGGTFNPASGDYVEARGAFQGWTAGFTLTNDPAGATPNIYSGTYAVVATPGTVEQFKFVVDGGNGPLGWENPTCTGGGNRSFTLAPVNGEQILPVIFFNDLSVNDILKADTAVTFSVSMTNAVGTDLHAFVPGTDNVFLNGLNNGNPGTYWSWTAFPPVPPMDNTNPPPGNLIYTTTVTVHAGSPLLVNYKYGINGFDNEAGFGQNHIRYIRTTGTYSMPLDTFGVQYVEPSFGNLAIGQPNAGHALITWLGRSGVHIQTKTSLNGGAWVDHPETDGLSSTNWPISGGNVFIRLIQPAQ